MSAALRLPLVPDGPSLDDEQARWIEAAVDCRNRGVRSAVWNNATGTGKTVGTAKLIKRGREEWGGRFLFVVDEDRLCKQAEDKFTRWGLRVAVEQGGRKAADAFGLMGGSDVTVATRQTLYEARLKKVFKPGDVTDLIIDEAHVGAKGKQLRTIREYLDPAFTLGLSATPEFADGERLVPGYFDVEAYHYPMEDHPDGRPGAISNGHLVPPMVYDCPAGVDLRKLKKSTTQFGRDYNLGQLEDRILGSVEVLVNAARDEFRKWSMTKALHFTPNVNSALAIARAYNAIGLEAAAIYGDHPDKDGLFGRYERGEIRVLVGCQMFVKGFDDPATDGLFLGRPTLSYPLARQMLGRGCRLSPRTGKTHCTVVGFRWVADGQGPVSTLDVFLQGADDRTRQIARKLAGTARRPVDAMKLAERAREVRRDEVERERVRKARPEMRLDVRSRSLNIRSRKVDLFSPRRDVSLWTPGASGEGSGAATPEQVKALVSLGFERVGRMNAEQAGRAIKEWSDRRTAGMSSFRQCRLLESMGFSWRDCYDLTVREASDLISRTKGKAEYAF